MLHGNPDHAYIDPRLHQPRRSRRCRSTLPSPGVGAVEQIGGIYVLQMREMQNCGPGVLPTSRLSCGSKSIGSASVPLLG
jgi:hypothetical protein